MKNFSMLSCMLFSTILFAGFNINGSILGYSKKDVTIQKAEGISYKNIAIERTDKNGSFDYRMGEDYKGILLISIEGSGDIIKLFADGKDINFRTTQSRLSSVTFDKNSINHTFQAYLKNENKGSLIKIFDYILTKYPSEDPFYISTRDEKNKVNDQKFNANLLDNYPLIKFYNDGLSDINSYSQIRDEISSLAERKNIINKLVNSGEYLETTNLLGDYVTSYFMLGNNIYKSEVDIDKNMKSDLDTLLSAVDIETERGQLVLARTLHLLKSYNFDDLVNEYIKDVEALTCEVSSVLTSKVKSIGAIREGVVIPNYKLPNGEKLHSLKNKYKVVLFWSPECPHCLKDFPNIRSMYPQLKKKGGELIAFGADTDKQKYNQLIKNEDWINFYDTNSEYLEKYGVTAYPTFILLDKNNIVKGNYSKMEDVLKNIK